MALDPKAALELIKKKQQVAAEEEAAEQVSIRQIKEKLIKLEQLMTGERQDTQKEKVRQEKLSELVADIKTVLPNQADFWNNVKVNQARIEDFLEVSFARVFSGLGGITKGLSTITSTIKSGFVGLKNSFISISTSTINAVKGFVQNAWAVSTRFLTLDIRQQLSNIASLVTGTIRTIAKAITGTIIGAINLAWSAITTVVSKVWGAVKAVASAIAGFIWDGIKGIASVVGRTFLFLTTRIVATIVTAITSALAPYLGMITLIFLGIGILTGKISEWWSGLLSWLGFGAGDRDASAGASPSGGFWQTFENWVWGSEGSPGWLRVGINRLKDSIGGLITRLGESVFGFIGNWWLGENGSFGTPAPGSPWGNIVQWFSDFESATGFGATLRSFGLWLRDILFGNEMSVEEAQAQLQEERRAFFEEIAVDSAETFQSGVRQAIQVAQDEVRRAENILERTPGNATARAMLEKHQATLDQLSEFRQRQEEISQAIASGETTIGEEGLLPKIGRIISNWWFGQDGNWVSAPSDSAYGAILQLFFGENSVAVNWQSQGGLLGTLKHIFREFVIIPIMELVTNTVIPALKSVVTSLANFFEDRGLEGTAVFLRTQAGNLLALGDVAGDVRRQAQIQGIERELARAAPGGEFEITPERRQELETELTTLKAREEIDTLGIRNDLGDVLDNMFLYNMLSLWYHNPFAANHSVNELIRRSFFEYWSDYAIFGSGHALTSYYNVLSNDGFSEFKDSMSQFSRNILNGNFPEDEWNETIMTALNARIIDSEQVERLERLNNSIKNNSNIAASMVEDDRKNRIFADDTRTYQLAEGIWDNVSAWSNLQQRSNQFFGGDLRDILGDKVSQYEYITNFEFLVPALAEGGVARPRDGGMHAVLAEAGDPEMIIPLNSEGAEFIVETMNRVNVGNTDSNIKDRLDSIDRKLKDSPKSEVMETPSKTNQASYAPVLEVPENREKFNFVKLLSMGMFEEKT